MNRGQLRASLVAREIVESIQDGVKVLLNCEPC